MKKFIKKNIYTIFLTILFLFIFLVLIEMVINKCNGHFTYALDDAYIHMSIAKNFAKHGVWGITKYGFTSSSPLWTLLLSGTYFIFGVNEYSPLILNIIFSILILILISNILEKENFNKLETLTGIFLIFLFTPIFSLIFLGEEHILQILIDTFFYINLIDITYYP